MARNTRSGRQKSFKHYLEFPPEVRSMVINEMEPADRCRFTRCSSLCLNEAQRSKNYIYGLKFDNSSEQSLRITVYHARFDRHEYQVEFRADSGRKCMEYSIPSGNSSRMLWSLDLDRSDDLVQLARNYFEKLLEFYQNSIQSLHITGESNYNFQVRSLNNLKDLDLSTNVGNIMEVISKRNVPLEELSYIGEMNDQLLGDFEYIYRVQDHLYMPELKLNIDQVRRLSADVVMIHIGTLTPNDVFNLITSWKNGELRENFNDFLWELNNSNFDAQQLWQLLQVVPDDPERNVFRIEHNVEAGKYAMLHHTNDLERLAFRVSSQRN